MRVEIYQITKPDEFLRRWALNYENTMKCAGKIDRKIYSKVYAGEVDCKSLEGLFYRFNLWVKPEGYIGTSLTVSDVVRVIESETVLKGYYFVDSVGFREIDFEC